MISYIDGKPGTGILTVIERTERVEHLEAKKKKLSHRVVAQVSGFSGPFSVAVDPRSSVKAGKAAKERILVTNFGSNDFAPYGTTASIVEYSEVKGKKKLTIVETLQLGIQPAGLVIEPKGQYAIVSNYNSLYENPVTFQNLTLGEGTLQIIHLPPFQEEAKAKASSTGSVPGSSPSCRVVAPTIAIGRTPSTLALHGDRLFICKYAENAVDVVDVASLLLPLPHAPN